MAKKSYRRSRRSHCKNRMYGGTYSLSGAPYGIDTMHYGSAMSIGQGEQFAELTRPFHGGGRRRSSRKMRKSRFSTKRRIAAHSRRMRGGMAPLSIFGNDTAGVARESAHMRGQDMALTQAAAYSASPDGQDNPNIPTVIDKQAGGRRRRSAKRKLRRRKSMRGGAIHHTGAPFSQTSSERLLADSPALAAEAARMESPTWKGVEAGTYLG